MNPFDQMLWVGDREVGEMPRVRGIFHEAGGALAGFQGGGGLWQGVQLAAKS